MKLDLVMKKIVERNIGEVIAFPDRPDFGPNMTPREIFAEGSFGGTYWRPIFSSVISQSLSNQHLEFQDWWGGIDDTLLTSENYDKRANRFGVSCGTSLDMWENKGWINEQDPYGWVQWYCRFFKGRRSPDDDRQIRRWKAFAGEKGRFRNQLINLVISRETSHDDESVSPVIRQSLQHWAYRLNFEDFEKAALDKWKSEIC
tara:strand:- start:8389 stop:8994 length:606 start_codon:yes stop_codon:yes gene_type:complete